MQPEPETTEPKEPSFVEQTRYADDPAHGYVIVTENWVRAGPKDYAPLMVKSGEHWYAMRLLSRTFKRPE